MDQSRPPDSTVESFEHYRRLLFSIAYRMTGSARDAEDLVQEAYLRYAQRAGAGPPIVSVKAYLCTIVTRLALDDLKSARVTREEYVGSWLPEPILTASNAALPRANLEQQEALSLAFLRLLEALSPPERAVFVLHEIFDYPFGEIGSMLAKSPANCRQIFHRARLALQDQQARFAPEPQRQRQLLDGFLSASQAGDMAALTSLLAEDAVSWADGGGQVQTNLQPIHGRQAVARFWSHWLNLARGDQLPLTVTQPEVNGSPALLFWYDGRLVMVLSLALTDAGIQEIDAQLNPQKLAYLQAQLGAPAEPPR